MTKIEKFLGSGFYTGFGALSNKKIFSATGTMASIVALLIYWIPGFENWYIIIPITLLFTFWGIPISTKFEKEYGLDPKECTIDEVVGMWLSLILLPKNLVISIVAFAIWRILDIIKIPPAKQFENLHGGLGIMMDDVMSALYTLAIMHILKSHLVGLSNYLHLCN